MVLNCVFYTIFINIILIVSCFHECVDLIYTSIMLIMFLRFFSAFVCLYFLVNTMSYFCLSALEYIFPVNNALYKFNIIIIIVLNVAIITHIWYRAKCHFTSISNTWYLITVLNMNKINPFFSETSQWKHKLYGNVAIITQIWHKPNTILQAWAMHHAW